MSLFTIVSERIIIKEVLQIQPRLFLSFSSLLPHLYQCVLCKLDTFIYVKQMKNEAVFSSVMAIFFQSWT